MPSSVTAREQMELRIELETAAADRVSVVAAAGLHHHDPEAAQGDATGCQFRCRVHPVNLCEITGGRVSGVGGRLAIQVGFHWSPWAKDRVSRGNVVILALLCFALPAARHGP